MTAPDVTSWDDFPGARHTDQILASFSGQPSIAMQNETHGAPAPAVDRGPDPVRPDSPPPQTR